MPPPAAIPGIGDPGFVPGAPGFGGGVFAALSAPSSGIMGFCVAFDADIFDESPLWTRLDDPTGPYVVQSYSWQRGRTYEFERTGTGTGRVTMVDITGEMDPTNTGGGFFGKLDPLKQAAIALFNPFTDTWSTCWRGYVSAWNYQVDVTERANYLVIDLVDALDVLAAAEMVPSAVAATPTFGSTLPALNAGNVYFEAGTTTLAVKNRIDGVLDQLGWPIGLREIFTGNVKLQETVYAPRTPVLNVLQDAADAEFPGVANVFPSKDGKIVFHGRLARFFPNEEQYHISTWYLGDQAAIDANPGIYVGIREPFEFNRDKENLYTAAISTPQNMEDAQADGQSGGSSEATRFGTRTWSAENLLTAGGEGTTALQETGKFSLYYLTNYDEAFTRVGQLTVRAAESVGDNAELQWAFVTGVDISDVIRLNTTHVGGGGFTNENFYVEGVHYEVEGLNTTNLLVTVTVDVSPATQYAYNPF